MSKEFDLMYESVSPCCGDGLDWEWNSDELHFNAECGCMKRYHLKPIEAELVKDSEDFEDDDE